MTRTGLVQRLGLWTAEALLDLTWLLRSCGGGVGAVARGGVSDGAVSVAAAGIVSIASDTTNEAGASGNNRPTRTERERRECLLKSDFESGMSGSSNIGRVVGLLTELSEQVDEPRHERKRCCDGWTCCV